MKLKLQTYETVKRKQIMNSWNKLLNSFKLNPKLVKTKSFERNHEFIEIKKTRKTRGDISTLTLREFSFIISKFHIFTNFQFGDLTFYPEIMNSSFSSENFLI